jgi:predicted metal-dependent hydrolase
MELAYEIRRSAARRKVTITVERDRSVIVHAPMRLSDDKVREIVESKRPWIFEKIRHGQKYSDLPHPPGKELVSGESALYLGKSYRIEVVDNNASEIQFSDRFVIPKSRAARRKTVLRDWYIERAHEIILPRVQRHARQLGVVFKQAKIVDNRYRWGSCTPKNSVNFNWRLIKAPMFVVDYVIVHELAHLREPNHTPQFWTIVRVETPAMERARTWLKENGQILEEDL